MKIGEYFLKVISYNKTIKILFDLSIILKNRVLWFITVINKDTKTIEHISVFLMFQNIERLRNHWNKCVTFTVLSSPTMMVLITSSVKKGTEDITTNAFSNFKQSSIWHYLNNLPPYQEVIFQTKYFLLFVKTQKQLILS